MTREEAIDILKHNYPSACFTDLCDAVDMAIKALSAQPERCEDCENFSKTRLLIPQPEIVRCKNCKHYEIYQLMKDGTDDRRYKPSYCTLLRHNFTPDWYCADGERKGEE